MDAAQALADLTEISSQVVHVAILDTDGSVLATTIREQSRLERFVTGIDKLLAEADGLRQTRGLAALSQVDAATLDGSVCIVRAGGRLIAVTTRPDPTIGLVFYDLKHCLRSIEGVPPTTPTAAEGEAEGAAPARPPRKPRKKADAST